MVVCNLAQEMKRCAWFISLAANQSYSEVDFVETVMSFMFKPRRPPGEILRLQAGERDILSSQISPQHLCSSSSFRTMILTYNLLAGEGGKIYCYMILETSRKWWGESNLYLKRADRSVWSNWSAFWTSTIFTESQMKPESQGEQKAWQVSLYRFYRCTHVSEGHE